jgi:hypothetical protein
MTFASCRHKKIMDAELTLLWQTRNSLYLYISLHISWDGRCAQKWNICPYCRLLLWPDFRLSSSFETKISRILVVLIIKSVVVAGISWTGWQGIIVMISGNCRHKNNGCVLVWQTENSLVHMYLELVDVLGNAVLSVHISFFLCSLISGYLLSETGFFSVFIIMLFSSKCQILCTWFSADATNHVWSYVPGLLPHWKFLDFKRGRKVYLQISLRCILLHSDFRMFCAADKLDETGIVTCWQNVSFPLPPHCVFLVMRFHRMPLSSFFFFLPPCMLWRVISWISVCPRDEQFSNLSKSVVGAPSSSLCLEVERNQQHSYMYCWDLASWGDMVGLSLLLLIIWLFIYFFNKKRNHFHQEWHAISWFYWSTRAYLQLLTCEGCLEDIICKWSVCVYANDTNTLSYILLFAVFYLCIVDVKY